MARRLVLVLMLIGACATTATTGPSESTLGPLSSAASEKGVIAEATAPAPTYPVPAYGGEVPEEYPFMLDCMEWYGFAGEVEPVTGEGLIFDHTPEAAEQFVTAITDCSNAWRELAGMPIGLPGPDELGQMYDRFMEIQRCLLANGFPVEDPPTRDVYVERVDHPWNPYNALYLDEYISPAVIEKAERSCPPE